MNVCAVDCREALRDAAAFELGIRVVVHRRCPILRNPCTPARVRCGHDEQFWLVPSGEQIARWRGGER